MLERNEEKPDSMTNTTYRRRRRNLQILRLLEKKNRCNLLKYLLLPLLTDEQTLVRPLLTSLSMTLFQTLKILSHLNAEQFTKHETFIRLTSSPIAWTGPPLS